MTRFRRLPPLLVMLVAIPAVLGALSQDVSVNFTRDLRLLLEGGNITDDYLEAGAVNDTKDHVGGKDKNMPASKVYEEDIESARDESESSSKTLESSSETKKAAAGPSAEGTTIKGAEKISKPPMWPDDDDDDFVAKKNVDKLDTSHVESSGNIQKEVDDKPIIANASADETSALEAGFDEGESTESLSKDITGGEEATVHEISKGTSVSEEEDASQEKEVTDLEETTVSTTMEAFHESKEKSNETSTFEQEPGADLMPDNKENINQSLDEVYTYSKATISTMDNTDVNSIGLPDEMENAASFEPLNEGTPSSEIAYHRNESNQEEDVLAGQDGGSTKSMHEIAMDENTNEENPVSIVGDSSVEHASVDEGVLDPSAQFCRPATNCMECLNLSIDHLRSNSDPCFWVGQCISAGQASTTENAPSGAYKCGEDGSSIYTNEDWKAALNAITGTSQVPLEDKRADMSMNTNYFDYDEDEDSFFENVKFTFNVLMLAAFVASGLLIRKRVINRLRGDSSLEMADVVKEEVIAFVTSIANFVKNKINGSGNSSTSEYRPIATSNRNESFERQTIPLSTAADEEWGWDDDEPESNVELPAMDADDGKEEEDLALAIAMSLAESTNGSSGTVAAAQPTAYRSPAPKPAAVKPKASVPFNARLKETKSPIAAPKPKAAVSPSIRQTNPAPAPPQGDSIEDLLEKMNSGGGPVITSFGQKPRTANAKPKPVPKKDSADDLFASMGFSNSFASKSEAPKSAPLPPSNSLAADNDDMDTDMDWGDDGDLDDLLDD